MLSKKVFYWTGREIIGEHGYKKLFLRQLMTTESEKEKDFKVIIYRKEKKTRSQILEQKNPLFLGGIDEFAKVTEVLCLFLREDLISAEAGKGETEEQIIQWIKNK